MRNTEPLGEDAARTARIRQNAAKTIIGAQLRVNEHRLKKSQDENKLSIMMARLYEVKKAMELEAS